MKSSLSPEYNCTVMEGRRVGVSASGRRYTCNLMKGVALAESRQLLLEWQPGEDRASFSARVAGANLLGKASRRRVRDLVQSVFWPRFFAGNVPPGELAQMMLKVISDTATAFRLVYYHAALADRLLYDFVTQWLLALYQEGRHQVVVDDGVAFIEKQIQSGLIKPPWSENVKLKTAQGLLAACRDGGILRGTVKKEFAPVQLPRPVFLYMAYYLKGLVASAARLVAHPDWGLFLLTPTQVEELFLEAHQAGDLGFYCAGGIMRVEWPYPDLARFVRGFTGTNA